MGQALPVVAAIVACAITSCGEQRQAPATGPLLRAVTPEGLDFRHRSGSVGNRELPEAMGGGVALFDYDRDGDLDVYLSQSGRMRSARTGRADGQRSGKRARNVLFAGDGKGRFEKA